MLYLLCVEEYRYVEIATVLDISVAAAQKRAQRGREILIERIGERHD
ncbi:sigma factor-like helix-turn-helix DNA-binding protein [Aminicella lysinilytica]